MGRRALFPRSVAGPAAAAVVAASLVTSLVTTVAAPSPAAAAPGPTATPAAAASRFLAGSLLAGNIDLDRVLALTGVAATAPASAVRTVASPLGVAGLSLLNATLPGGVHVPLSDFIRIGAVNQFAQVTATGVSRAAAGAVADSGVVDTRPGSAYPADATLDLAGLLGATGRRVVSSAGLTLGGLAAVAAVDSRHRGAPAPRCADLSDPVHCRGYTVARGRLTLASPTVATLVGAVDDALGAASATVDSTLRSALVATVLTTVTDLLTTLDGLLGGLGVLSNSLTVSVHTDLSAALAPLLRSRLTDGVVSLDLSRGSVTVDLAGLVGGLDALAPNTSVLGPAAVTELIDRIDELLAGLVRQVGRAVISVLDTVAVGIGGGICLLKTLGSCVAGLSVRYSGTLGGLLDGGSGLTVSGSGLLSLTGATLTAVLTTLRSSLTSATTPLPTTARTGVTAAAGRAVSVLTTAVHPVLRTLGSLVRVTANVQEPGALAGSFREVAMRVAVGSPANGVASIDLARAEVAARPAATGGPGRPSGSATGSAPSPGRTIVVPGSPGSSVVVPGEPDVSAGGTTGAAVIVPFPDRTAQAGDGGTGGSVPWTALGALLLAFAALVAALVARFLRRKSRRAAAA